jgi:hypothetical protein
MSNFREWLGQSENSMAEVQSWISGLMSRIAASIRPSEGYISVSISSLASVAPITPSGAVSPVGAASVAPMSLSASVVHSGGILDEVTEKGWKGKAAVQAAAGMGLGWNAKDTAAFSRGMNAGRRSIPQLVGKEMGLLFEVEVFAFLVQTFKLKVVGQKDLSWALQEQVRLGGVITGKVGANLGRLVIEFIKQHAVGKTGMGNLIHSKAMALVRQCVVDSIEFMGGDGEAGVSARLREDTADLRIGCEKYLPGMRGDVGFSLKAVTETQVDVRSLGPMKALSILGGSRRALKTLKDMGSNPLYESSEKRAYLLDQMKLAAEANYTNKPKKFAALLELLVTGGADTIPAYRSLLQSDSSPGWSPAIGKDFVTGEGPGKKLGAKMGSSPVIEVKANSTYVKIVYMVGGGNHYGTSVQFEPDVEGSKVSVVVSNLVNRGVK